MNDKNDKQWLGPVRLPVKRPKQWLGPVRVGPTKRKSA
jgi:hypothetical protein